MSWNRTAWILAASLALTGCAGGKKSSDTAPDTTVQTAPPATSSTAAPPGGTMPDVTTGAAPGTLPVKPDPTPAHITVQHILIGFAGSVPGKGITRTQDEAKKLAYEVLARARKGELRCARPAVHGRRAPGHLQHGEHRRVEVDRRVPARADGARVRQRRLQHQRREHRHRGLRSADQPVRLARHQAAEVAVCPEGPPGAPPGRPRASKQSAATSVSRSGARRGAQDPQSAKCAGFSVCVRTRPSSTFP